MSGWCQRSSVVRDLGASAGVRQAMGHFATGVTVVTSVGDAGEPVGTTASAVTSLSLDPPLVLVCFDRASVTLQAIRAHGAFVVNVPRAPRRDQRQRRRPAGVLARVLPAARRDMNDGHLPVRI